MPPNAATPVLSPYLRPVVDPRTGALSLDLGVAGDLVPLDAVEARIVRALWEAKDGALGPLRAELGEAVERTLASLRRRGVLFDSLEACEAHVERVVKANLPRVPLVDQVELTNACPMRCGFCPRGVPGRITRPTGFMELPLFRSLLAQLPREQAHYHPLELNNVGESLLHREVDRFVAAATEKGLPTELSVNPSLLTPELAGRLLDAGLVRLVVSLDGMDAATLLDIRGPAASWEKAERNLDAVIELAGSRARPPSIVIQMIDLERNRHQREAFLARWGHTGAPFVSAYVKDLDGPDPLTGRPSPRPVRFLCTFPFASVSIAWDGRVTPCCRDSDVRLPLGDLRTQSLEEIWNGEPVRALREAWLANHFPAGHLCAGCAFRRDQFASTMSERHPDRATANPLAW